jgi:hypothetical protein
MNSAIATMKKDKNSQMIMHVKHSPGKEIVTIFSRAKSRVIKNWNISIILEKR